jgi:hypothetical protein
MNTSAFFSKENFTKVKLITAAALIAFGVMSRMFLHGANIETLTVVSLLAGSLLGGVWTIVIGLIVVASTDMAIGNTNIFLYTWSAWALVGFFGYVVRKQKKSVIRHSLQLTGMGLLANLFFYAFTNFGVWHIGGLYQHTATGLINCYIAGIPFLKNQLLSTLMFVPTVSAVTIAVWNRLPQWLHTTESKTVGTTAYARSDK